jgi:hypothetical protein
MQDPANELRRIFLPGTSVNKALLVCLLIFRSSEPCQSVATAEDVEVEGNPTGCHKRLLYMVASPGVS